MDEKPKSPQDTFIGLDGTWGSCLKFGISGAMVGCLIYLLAYELPETRRQAAIDRKVAADATEKASLKSFDHGDRAVKSLADALRDQTKSIDANADQHREVLRDGQRQMIELQRQLMSALLGKRDSPQPRVAVVGPPAPDPLVGVERPTSKKTKPSL